MSFWQHFCFSQRFLILKRADFGHSYGEGEDGYADAHEFHAPQEMADEAVFMIA